MSIIPGVWIPWLEGERDVTQSHCSLVQWERPKGSQIVSHICHIITFAVGMANQLYNIRCDGGETVAPSLPTVPRMVDENGDVVGLDH